MLTYLIQVTGCWMVFYLLYIVLFRKETFYQSNRWYLLSTLLLGLVLPLAQYINLNPAEVAPTVIYLQPVVEGLAYIEVQAETTSHDYWQILLWIYIAGCVIVGSRFVYGLSQIYELYSQSEKKKMGELILVQTEKMHLPFSFFNYLFWSNQAELNSTEEEKIWQHEEAHIQEGHTIDVLLLEILSVLLWCSPMIYLYKKSLRDVHEYLADARVLESMGVKQYGYLLLRQSQPGLQMALANHFIQSQLKKRIVMMTKTKSEGWKGLKYLVGIPLMLTLFTLFAFKATDMMDFFKATGKTSASWNINKLGANGYDANAVNSILLEEFNQEQSIFNTDTKERIFEGEFVQSLKLANFHEAYRDIANLFPQHQAEINEIAYGILVENNINARIDKGTIIYSNENTSEEEEKGKFKFSIDPNKKQIYFVNDVEFEGTLDELGALVKKHEPYDITEVTGIDPVKEYGERAKDGLVYFTFNTSQLSSSNISKGNPLIIINGKETEHTSVNDISPDDIKEISVLKGEEAIARYGDKGKDGVILITLKAENQPDEIFKIVEEMPRFYSAECEAMESKAEREKCAQKKMLEFIYKGIKYPKTAIKKGIEGTTVIRFVVEKNGTISETEIVREIGGGCGKESLRMVDAMTKWIPGKQRGKIVRVHYNLPVKYIMGGYQLPDEAKKEIEKPKDSDKKEPIFLEGEQVFKIVDEMPRFYNEACEAMTDTEERQACTTQEMLMFVYKNIKYPKAARESGIQGTVVGRFVVDVDGSVINPEIVRKIGGGCDEEALRVFKAMPKWIPGMKDGKPVKTQFNMPIKYKLEDNVEEEFIEPTEAAPSMELYDVKVFPNPATDFVNIKSQLEAVPTTIWVVDVNGREIYKEVLNNFDGILDKQIDLSNASKGALILQVQQGDKVLTKKIIRQ